MFQEGLKVGFADGGFTSSDTYSRNASVSVADLTEVCPELHVCEESFADFAKKVRIAAEHMRGVNAVYDLQGRLVADSVSTKIFSSEDNDD